MPRVLSSLFFIVICLPILHHITVLYVVIADKSVKIINNFKKIYKEDCCLFATARGKKAMKGSVVKLDLFI